MGSIRDHRQLDVWKLADDVRRKVRVIASRPPVASQFDLHRQLVGASESACANIAEGFARYHPRDFARFLGIARGSMTELIEHLDSAESRGLVTASEAQEAAALARRACGAATRLIVYLRGAKAPHT